MSMDTAKAFGRIKTLCLGIRDARLRIVKLIVEEEIEKMREEHIAERRNVRAPVLQGHNFGAALIFLKDRITLRLEREAKE